MGDCTGKSCDFEREYALAGEPALLDLERTFRGTAYGGTSWTTLRQAEEAAAALRLNAGRTLLEIGAGAGWPALLIAQLSGCSAVLTDPAPTGLRLARERAARDGLADRCLLAVADGAALPFADCSFDAVHHADVLCCMAGKQQLLRECRRVARPGATMAFSVIWLARTPAGPAERELLEQSGPPHPDAGGDYSELLDAAGWTVHSRSDVTAELLRCVEVLLRESAARRAELVQVLGAVEFEERTKRRRSTRDAIERGLLRRDWFVVG